jgi:hypothetical protein
LGHEAAFSKQVRAVDHCPAASAAVPSADGVGHARIIAVAGAPEMGQLPDARRPARRTLGSWLRNLQLSAEVAEAYEAAFVPTFFAQWAPRLLDAAAVGDGQRVLDVACGTGIVAPHRRPGGSARRARSSASTSVTPC